MNVRPEWGKRGQRKWLSFITQGDTPLPSQTLSYAIRDMRWKNNYLKYIPREWPIIKKAHAVSRWDWERNERMYMYHGTCILLNRTAKQIDHRVVNIWWCRLRHMMKMNEDNCEDNISQVELKQWMSEGDQQWSGSVGWASVGERIGRGTEQECQNRQN